MPNINSWHDYFVMVGGGSAALTGLIFVAMTLHLDEIITNPVHRHRARTILMGLTAVFIRCGLVLMGDQRLWAVALELIGVLTVVEFLLYSSIRQAMRSADRGVLLRTIGSFACLLLEEAGAIVVLCRRTGNDVVLHLHGHRRVAASRGRRRGGSRRRQALGRTLKASAIPASKDVSWSALTGGEPARVRHIDSLLTVGPCCI